MELRTIMESRAPDDLGIISFSTSSGSDNNELSFSASSDSEAEQPVPEDSLEITYHTKSKLTRQPSSVDMKSVEGIQVSFVEKTCIGRGNHAAMFRFTEKDPPPHTQPLTFTVRKPHTDLSYHKNQEDYARFIALEKQAFNFRQTLYPEESPYKFILIEDKHKSSTDTDFPFHAKLRVIFPEIKNAQTLNVFLQENQDYDLLALVIFNIMTELQRIHAAGVLHGDISSTNILINTDDLSIHFIDFTFAYPKHEYATMGFFTDVKEMLEHYFAPERKALKESVRLKLQPDSTPFKPIKADFSQDIYSVAIMLEDALATMKRQPDKSQFINNYLCIIEFIAKGKCQPLERPTLNSLITKLQPLLFNATLKHHLIKLNTNTLIPLLDKFIAESSDQKICQLLLTLCRNEEYHCIKAIADYISMKKPTGDINAVLSLFIHLTRYAKRLTKLTNSLFGPADRLSICKEVSLAFELAELITYHPQTVCTQMLYADIQQFQTLNEIFQDLLNTGYVCIAPDLTQVSAVDTQTPYKIMP